MPCNFSWLNFSRLPQVKRLAILGALACVLLGCVHHQARLYPVCFYSPKPPAEEISREYVPKLQTAMRLVVRDEARQVLTADARWFVVSTSTEENAQLAGTWPRVACIGRAGSGSEVRMEADCVDYIHQFITKQQYLQFGQVPNAGDAGWNEMPGGQQLVYCDKH